MKPEAKEIKLKLPYILYVKLTSLAAFHPTKSYGELLNDAGLETWLDQQLANVGIRITMEEKK